MKNRRPYTDEEKRVIRALWPTKTRDRDLAARLGRGRGSIHRHAREFMGLPPRTFVRVRAPR